MLSNKYCSLVITAAIFFCGCVSAQKMGSPTESLKATFKDDFLIGTALSADQIEGRDNKAAGLVLQHFNAATPENIMKSMIIHPAWDQYNFDLADKLVDYGNKNNIKINGHTLVWHSQLPAFMQNMKDADSVKKIFTDHINTVARRYNGKVFSWDVVNEALNEDGTMRKSIFQQKLGDDFVTEAFRRPLSSLRYLEPLDTHCI